MGRRRTRTSRGRERHGPAVVADIAAVATLIGERARLAMLDALVDERSLPASELARRAGVSSSTASGHLAKLVAGGLVLGEQHGRQRRYRLASPAIAAAIEALAAIAPTRPVRSLREATRTEFLRDGRTCYDHLAGRLGVELTNALEKAGLLRRHDGAYLLTRRGEQTMRELGIDIADVQAQRRSFAFPCLDWTEQREHLAGALGAALAERLFTLGWVERVGAGRAAAVTDRGRKELRARFSLELREHSTKDE